MENIKLIIIPDVHGRDFWRRSVKDIDGNTKVVFLGDYLDQYDDDWIPWDDAFQGFQDIIAMKKAQPDSVTLLLGNHDLHYIYSSLRGSRYNAFQADVIRKELVTNLECFQMAAEFTVGCKRYLLSHAGVHPYWIMHNAGVFGSLEAVSADLFNNLMDNPQFIDTLADVSSIRGGSAMAGSMVWADIHEFDWCKQTIPGVTQICGHTRLPGGRPKVAGDVWCLDCQRAFVLTEEGIAEYW